MKKLSSVIMAIIAASAISACGGDSVSEDLVVSSLNVADGDADEETVEAAQNFCESIKSKLDTKIAEIEEITLDFGAVIVTGRSVDGVLEADTSAEISAAFDGVDSGGLKDSCEETLDSFKNPPASGSPTPGLTDLDLGDEVPDFDCSEIEQDEEYKNFVENCNVTVGELNSCMDDAFNVFTSFFDSAKCSDVKGFFTGEDAQSLFEIGSSDEEFEPEEPQSCKDLEEKCPSVNVVDDIGGAAVSGSVGASASI